MEVVPITLAISLWLVLVFVVFFLQEHARGRMSSAERDSLLPLADETPRTPGAGEITPAAAPGAEAVGRGPSEPPGAFARTSTSPQSSDSRS
ncbi:MAG: hypothetical protein HS122_13790 [Opitutaceae bacterium]|nr:hypothetical protein [Opitutaceae bacterium]